MKLAILVTFAVLTHRSTAIDNDGFDVRARFVRRISDYPGGVVFDILAGVRVISATPPATQVSAVDYTQAVLGTFTETPTAFDAAASIIAFNDIPDANAISVYVENWGMGVGGVLYGSLNTNLSISGAAGPTQFLIETIGNWLDQNPDGVDDSSDPVLSTNILSLKRLVVAFGAEIGGLVYGSFAAFMAMQNDQTNIHPTLVPNLKGVLYSALGNNAQPNADIFVCEDPLQGELCTDILHNSVKKKAATFLEKTIKGDPVDVGQVHVVRYLWKLLKPATPPPTPKQ